MKDLHGKAILDYLNGDEEAALIIHTSYGQPEEMPVEVFFRDELDFSTLEHLALIECKGKVLDLGAGAGAHSIVLQNRGFDVEAIENSPGCAEAMQQIGVGQVTMNDYRLHRGSYDTILCLMNGLGLAGKLDDIPDFIDKCMSFLTTGGQLLIDSSDISYLYQENIKKPAGYCGEVSYQYEYRGEKGEWFDWIYVDQDTMKEVIAQMGLQLEILHTEETDQYLMRITREN